MTKFLRPILALALLAAVFAAPAEPCSRVLWNDNGHSVLVGRNMDWLEDTTERCIKG